MCGKATKVEECVEQLFNESSGTKVDRHVPPVKFMHATPSILYSDTG